MSTEPALATTGDSTSGSLVFSALKDRSPRIATAVALGTASYPVVKNLYTRTKNATGYVITIYGTDPMYDALHQWVMEQLPEKKHRALMAYTGEGNKATPLSDGPEEVGGSPLAPTKKLLFRYNGSRTQRIKINGHRVSISTTDGDKQQVGDRLIQIKPPLISLSVQSKAAKDSLVGVLEEVFDRTLEKKKPAFYLGTAWGSWNKLQSVPPRAMDSVVLQRGQLERIVADLERFLAAESEYIRRSIPWHRGYLFEGPPGGGKTSCARALAHHFNMDVRYISPSDMRGDSELLDLISAIHSGSLLILEDVDVFHAAKNRDDDTGKLTMSGLLNALDGIATPSGLIKVLTSNQPGVLDAALKRPGRVDVVEHFSLADSDQIRRLFEWFYGTKPKKIDGGILMAPSDVNGIMQRNPDDPEAALAEVHAFRHRVAA